jgi:cell division protein FtsL
MRRLLWCFAATVVCSLIMAVGFHVFVAQGQLQIDQLEGEVGEQQHRYEQLRLDVARLASPERITARAAELGMVASTEPPVTVTVPGDPTTALPPPPDSTATTLAESWPKVKQHLDAQP